MYVELDGPNAKRAAVTFFGSSLRPLHVSYVNAWLKEKAVSCVISEHAIALLSKQDYDPMRTHDHPLTLAFIYTTPAHRRTQVASNLLRHLMIYKQLTVFCDSDASYALMDKVGLSKVNVGPFHVYRYP